ncbi:CoA-dependent acyltransferase [Colletotrichum somersetense]|nr:CoA-dependent acyltransferase [Colletotrichum somersetense]
MTPQEAAVVDMLREMLGLPRVGVDDNFLHLGGDSLLAIRLSARARGQGWRLSVADIFRYPRVGDMARHLTGRGADSDRDRSPEGGDEPRPFSLLDVPAERLKHVILEAAGDYGIAPKQVQDLYPASAMQEGLMASSTGTDAGREEQQQQAYVLRQAYRLPEGLDMPRFCEAWRIAAGRCDILRSRMVSRLDGALMVICAEPPPVSVMVGRGETPLEEYMERQQTMRFRYGKPLAHHASYDGWSLKLVWDDVVDAYRREAALPPLIASTTPPRPSFASFVRYVWQIPAGPLEEFCYRRLADVERSPFPLAKTSRLVRLPVRPLRFDDAAVSVSTLIQAAWGLVLTHYGGVPDLVFGVTVSGRGVALEGVESVAGPLIATVPRRENVSASIPYQYFPLDRILHLGLPGCELQLLLSVQPAGAAMDHSLEDDLGIRKVPSCAADLYPYPLVVDAWPAGGHIHVDMHHDPLCLTANAAESLLKHFDNIMERLARSEATDAPGQVMVPAEDDLRTLAAWSWGPWGAPP